MAISFSLLLKKSKHHFQKTVDKMQPKEILFTPTDIDSYSRMKFYNWMSLSWGHPLRNEFCLSSIIGRIDDSFHNGI